MIKKNTKIILEGENNERLDALKGGIPLTKGEIITLHEGNKITEYKVIGKEVDCYIEEDDQIVNITYILRKK